MFSSHKMFIKTNQFHSELLLKESRYISSIIKLKLFKVTEVSKHLTVCYMVYMLIVVPSR